MMTRVCERIVSDIESVTVICWSEPVSRLAGWVILSLGLAGVLSLWIYVLTRPRQR